MTYIGSYIYLGGTFEEELAIFCTLIYFGPKISHIIIVKLNNVTIRDVSSFLCINRNRYV